MSLGAFQPSPVFGNMIPRDCIVSKGYGDTDIGGGNKNPWETGSFDTALVMARIENFNIIRYTSVLPPEAKEIPIETARRLYHPGAVMGTIMAQTNGYRGELICAGVGTIQVKRIADGIHIAGYAAEYMGNGSTQEAVKSLHKSLLSVVYRRYNSHQFMVFDERFCVQEHLVRHRYGSVIALIGFLSNIYPML